MTTTPSGEIWFKWQRGLRTAAQVLVTGAGILAAVVAVAPDVLSALAGVLPGPVLAWLGGVVVAAAGISTALARIMAIPAVDRWLKRLGLGSAPRSVPVAPPANPLPSTAAAVDTAARTREL